MCYHRLRLVAISILVVLLAIAHFTSAAEPRGVSATERLVALRKLAKEASTRSAKDKQQVVQDLTKAIREEADPLIRAEVVVTLAYYPDPKSDRVLRAAINDPDVDVRIAACRAWTIRGGPESTQMLTMMLSGDADQGVRLAAAQALGKSKDSVAVAALMVLGDADENLRLAAAQALTKAKYDAELAIFLPPEQLKPACCGLMTSGWGKLPPAELTFIDSAAVNVQWKDLEPEDQKFEGPGWEKIEEARRRGLHIRLRVLCGIYAPEFVRKLGGVTLSDAEHNIDTSQGGVAIWNEFSKRGGATICFWKPEVLDQYEQLMTEIARRYEDVPELCEVCDSACMTVFAEPFYRAHRHGPSNQRLFEAGLSFERDLAAHRRAIEIHDRLFRKTRTSLAVNPWDIIDDSPSHYRQSWKDAKDLVDWARKRMGKKLVLQNNGFFTDSDKALSQDPEQSHLAYLHSVPGPKGFQPRRSPASDEQLLELVELARRFGANFMEFGGFRTVDPDKLRKADASLRANPL